MDNILPVPNGGPVFVRVSVLPKCFCGETVLLLKKHKSEERS